MPTRRSVKRRRTSFRSIGEVIGAMKNLALVEIAKVGRTRSARRELLEGVRAVAAEIAAGRPELLRPARGPTLVVAIGSERGFCGDFNERVVDRWSAFVADRPARAIVVGARLAARLPAGLAVVETLAGPTVAEDVPAVLTALVAAIERAQADREGGVLPMVAISHDDDDHVRVEPLLPLFLDEPPAGRGAEPDRYLSPAVLFAEIVDHYVTAALDEIFAQTLVSENRKRLAAMEAANRRVERHVLELTHELNRLRQEEITEEIELLMIGNDGPSATLSRS